MTLKYTPRLVDERSSKIMDDIKRHYKGICKHGVVDMSFDQAAIGFLIQKIAGLQLVVEELARGAR